MAFFRYACRCSLDIEQQSVNVTLETKSTPSVQATLNGFCMTVTASPPVSWPAKNGWSHFPGGLAAMGDESVPPIPAQTGH
jgi:hypothetical protein